MLLKKWIKLLVIRTKIEENKEYEIKRELKNLLILISLRISKLRSEILLSRKRLLGRVNRLEKLNHINDYKLISYNFNKNEMIRKSIISKLIINLLENIVNGVNLITLFKGSNSISNGKTINNDIIISKPVIKENLSKVEIIFYYFIPNYKSDKWFNRVNMYLNKLRSSKSLIRLNNNYSVYNYKSHEKLLNDNIFNGILNIRNKVNNTISINNNTNINNIETLKVNNLVLNELNEILLINKVNSTLSLLSENNNKIINKKSVLNNQVRNIHNKVEVKDLVSNYLLKNKLNLLNNNKLNKSESLLNIKNNDNNIINYMISSIDVLLGNLNSKDNKVNKLNMIISKYFGLKEVEIKGIHLKYEFNNTEILVKLIRKGISKKTRTVSRMFRFRLRNRIPLLYDKGVLKNRINSNLVKNLMLNNNILVVNDNLKTHLLNNNLSDLNNNENLYNDIKDYLSSENKYNLNDNILYKNIVGWSLLLKGKVGGRKGKNRSTKIFMSTGSFKNTNLFVNNLLDPNSKSNYSKDRLRLNYIKNSNLISYVDKSTNNGKLGISLKFNVL